ncbi:hypothetical protein LX64_05144 [Chitinophaga skermanii]|uniref:Transposase IS200-like domain-containing protein n=1 Tax=Chitinophaga skermanii TaxID=331697 RepID=A0A327Q099_9BACT|nr:hypothetical protein [Chitinophaga skermanii]RAI97473.1 hypothetical protein LX64_05144 [Chitinophaga skermanii]
MKPIAAHIIIHCRRHKALLHHNIYKAIIHKCIAQFARKEFVWLYGYVILPSAIHLVWQSKTNSKRDYTMLLEKLISKKLKSHLQAVAPGILQKYAVKGNPRKFQFWEVPIQKSPILSVPALRTKIWMMHFLPITLSLANKIQEYEFSSAQFYENEKHTNAFVTDFHTHFDHLGL